LGSFPSVCRGVTNAVITFSDLANVGPDTVMFAYTGAPQSWTVPANVTSLKFDLLGASGGTDDIVGTATPGKGARVQGSLSVAPGSMLNLYVGGKGGDGSPSGATGGYNGGGSASYYYFGGGGAGGGATDIRIGGTSLGDRKVVAGGGGGNGADNSPVLTSFAGGAGGGLTGANGGAFNSSASRGGNQIAGGAPSTYLGWAPGSYGSLGMGGSGSPDGYSGGGGGGYYGGGGGAWSGGAGGSSFVDGVVGYSVTHTRGANDAADGNGMATIYYVNPGTYTIIWDATAESEGFLNVADGLLPANYQFNVAVPTLAAPGTYHATLRINNVNCNSIDYPIEVTIKPIPTVDPVADQIFCHGDVTTDVPFSGPISGGSYSWVNDNPAIGLDPAGTGHIPSFSPINGTPLPVSAGITVTPQADGCIGAPMVFHIVDNPVPVLNSTMTPEGICNNTLFSYIPTSLTPGTSFAWSRATMAGIANPPASGTDNPNETLFNTTTDPITVSYVYTLSANSCTNTVTVNVVVNPSPALTSTTTPAALCNNGTFMYTPTSSSTMATLTWTRPVAAGISNAAASGTGAISETLLNTTTSPKTVHYAINLGIGGCNYTEDVAVVVNPPLLLTSASSRNVCDSDLLEYAPTSNIGSATITWSRGPVTGISNPAATGVGDIFENLYNTTADPIVVNYIYTLSAFGCSMDHTLAINVKPSPKLTSSLSPAGVCTNSLFTYSASSATVGTTFEWARDTVAGIVNPTIHVLSGNVSELLISTADTTLMVPYRFTSTASGCPNSQLVMVPVFPLPKISNDDGNLAVCDSALLTYSPTSLTPGATYAWTRNYEAGISNVSASGTGSPNERLNNTTYISVPATYMFTIMANGCSNSQNVIVQVRPSPILTSNTAATCSGAPFEYVPVSYTTLASFAWSRNSSNVTPATRSGEGNIVDTLTQGTTGQVTVTYDFDLTIFGCVNKQTVFVTVNPAPAVPVIGTHPSADLCNNVTAMNFGAAAPAPDGYSYLWSVKNATLHATGSTTQYALVSFNTPGTATITLTSRIGETTCTSKSDFTVNVGTNIAETPEVIYFNQQFICKQIEQASYQWGYDDAKTLDSTILVGETNQNYANAYPDFSARNYWIMTTRNGCMQKTYYNKPAGVADVNTASVDMKLFPNPTSNILNVAVSDFVSGKISFEVFNMMGQKIQSVPAKDNKAQISVAELPAGAYIVDCYSDGLKVAAARFIKN
jgi:hypothetical protein